MTEPIRQFLKDVERFWASVDQSGECWIWTGELNPGGYGRFRFWNGPDRSSRLPAHRLSLVLAGVTVPDDLVVMHSCDNRPCVRPAHLRVGTQMENMRDAVAKGRFRRCKWGHRLNGSNLYVRPTDGAKVCRECAREADRRYRDRRALTTPAKAS